jgi:hypothetical protein
MPELFAATLSLFAQSRRARNLQRLWDGDPVAWTILILVIVGVCAWYWWKSRAGETD